MADTEKDRLGEKLRARQKGNEDEFIARRERELLEQQRRERREQSVRKDGGMHCPRCGVALRERIEHDITIDECPDCGGLWLDRGELEHLGRREQEGWFGRLLRAR